MAKSEQKIGVGFGIMILKGHKILLGLRNEDAAKAKSALHGEGTWTMPGGKMHFGEKFEDACFREVFEETGVKIKKSHLKLISISNDTVPDAHFVTIGFLCQDFSGEPKTMEPDEITRWEWFSLDDLPKNIFFCSRDVMNNYFSKRVYKSVI